MGKGSRLKKERAEAERQRSTQLGAERDKLPANLRHSPGAFDAALKTLHRARFLTFAKDGSVIPNPITELRVLTRKGEEVPLGDARADPTSDALVAKFIPGMDQAYPDGESLMFELVNGILTGEVRAATEAETRIVLSDPVGAIEKGSEKA